MTATALGLAAYTGACVRLWSRSLFIAIAGVAVAITKADSNPILLILRLPASETLALFTKARRMP